MTLPAVVMCAGWVGAAASTVRALPQAVHTLRGREAAGLSCAGIGAAVANSSAWTAYAVAVGAEPLVAASAATLAVDVLLFAALVRAGGARRSGLGIVACWALVLAAAPITAGLDGLGVALAGSVAVSTVPQLTAAWRAPSVRGVDPRTWSIAAVEAAAWGVYATGGGAIDIALVGYSVVLGACAAGVLVAVACRGDIELAISSP